MLTQRFVCLTPIVLTTLLLAACSSQSHQPQPAPDAPPASSDGLQADELAALPQTVLVGTDQSGAVDMRIPGAELTDADDSHKALAAFQSGLSVKVAGSGDELDQSSSTASWAPFGGTKDYATYAPKAYSRKNQGKSYDYGHAGSVQIAGWTIHVYKRPGCTPASCQGDKGPSGNAKAGGDPYDQQLAAYFKTYGVYAVSDSEYYGGSKAQVALGERLFYDTKLSSSGAVSCASCHLTSQGTANVYSLPATGFVLSGQKKGRLAPSDVLSRNTPALFNLGHTSYKTMFWDSRIAVSGSSFTTPAGDQTPLGLDNALAAQALFPLVTSNEFAGCNAGALGLANQSADPKVLWDKLMVQVLASKEYQDLFAAAFPDISGGQYGIHHLANALAAFQAVTWRSDKSPFDQYVRGDLNALNPEQKRGATYFYGKAQCGSCHSGPFQTDHGHHAVGVVQFGPGAGDGKQGWDDYGYGRTTGQKNDRYRFRTPSLRNTALTGPWGHNGAYSSLRQFVEHYKNPAALFDQWNPGQVILPSGMSIDQAILGAWNDRGMRSQIKNANEFKGVDLKADEVDAIVIFLQALSDSNVAKNSQILFKN